MPWREIWPMDEKMRMVAAALAAKQSMRELCAQFGVSRKTGYKWLSRYAQAGPEGLYERSRAPHRVRWAIAPETAGAILAIKQAHPSWGPKKLRGKLIEQGAGHKPPALSTIGELLRRHGLTLRRKRRRGAVPNPGALTVAEQANQVWAIDFKGWFRTGDRARCDPLTITDIYSRYLLCAQVVGRPDYKSCRAQLERVFRQYGLPQVIRSDNGPPFASPGAGGLSRLGVWWVKLGITPERIEPGKPEQNGSHERMHRTLKAETANPPAANLAEQQLRFDGFRREFNQERPHEALGQTAPARHYSASPRSYPKKLQAPAYPDDYLVRRVRSNGQIKWAGKLIFVSQPLVGELVGVKPTPVGDAKIYFGPVSLGVIDRATLKLKRNLPGSRGGLPSSPSTPAECEKVLPMLPV